MFDDILSTEKNQNLPEGSEECPACMGTGHDIYFVECPVCKGTGVVKSLYEYDVFPC